MFLSFFELGIFVIISFFLIFILLLLSNTLAPKNITNEKTSAYECGFVPFNEARNSFEVHFYVIGILFIIFDIEIIFLVPWIFNLANLNFLGFFSMFIFLYLFLVGFLYEWDSKLINLTVIK